MLFFERQLLWLLLFLLLYMKKVISPALELKGSDKIWRFVWLIPAVFYFMGYYSLYCIKDRTPIEVALRPANSVAMLFVNLCALLVYYVVAMLITESDRNRALQEQNHQLSIREVQYKNLQERIKETRQASPAMLIIAVDNRFCGESLHESGISSKHDGEGIGIGSVKISVAKPTQAIDKSSKFVYNILNANKPRAVSAQRHRLFICGL